MKGIVKFLNEKNGFFAVELDNGEFSVCEISGECNLELGDKVSGELEKHGDAVLKNISRSESFSVVIEDFHCDRNRAIELLRRFLG